MFEKFPKPVETLAANKTLTIDKVDDSAIVIHIHAELDIATCADLDRAIERAETMAEEKRRVVVSMIGCRYCDSSCISSLLKAATRIGKRFFVIVTPTSLCWRIFDIVGMAKKPYVVSTIEEALRMPLG